MLIRGPHQAMTLLTAEVRDAIPMLYSQEGVPDAMIVAKFFTPDAGWTWYVTEGAAEAVGGASLPLAGLDLETPEIEDVRFFGYADDGRGGGELGYFSLAELITLRGGYRLGVERDTSWRPRPLSSVRDRR